MRSLAITLIAAISIFTTSAFTTTDYGRVRLPGEATIKHDGDYAVYNLTFDNACYSEESISNAEVSNNVFNFASWLDERSRNFHDGHLEYWIDLISTHRDENFYLDFYAPEGYERRENPCYHKFSTSQSVTVRLNRAADLPAITQWLVQGFYEEIHQYLWPLNHLTQTESHAWSSARVHSVYKGVHEATLERMKEQAYSQVARVATGRFLALLGQNYTGQWFLHGADFTNERYVSKSHYELDAAGPAPLPVIVGPHEPAPVPPPAVINLEPLQYYVDGVFEFGFTRDFNDIPGLN